MTDETEPTLDPDEVECPQCAAPVGQVCRTPTGRKARSIHRVRRELAASTPRSDDQHESAHDQHEPTKKASKRRPPSPEARSKGGKARAAKARRERAELDKLLVDAKARAVMRRAEELADDSVDWDKRRMALRRQVLEAAAQTWATFHEAVEHYARIQTDEQGRPTMIHAETDRGKVIEILDRRGTFGPDDIKALATAAGIALDKLRLEEGSPTSRSDHTFSGVPGEGFADLDDATLRDFVGRAAGVLDEIDNNGEEG